MRTTCLIGLVLLLVGVAEALMLLAVAEAVFLGHVGGGGNSEWMRQ